MLLPFGSSRMKMTDEVDEIEHERFNSNLFVEFNLKPKSPEVIKETA